ncbi:MAG TPA: 50S ribosomal protein L18 [Candidatus Nanoarchaeia archaeon]|nr:50S ribosomal protein L18 [Candidatus Nanoarchaeia archaeon]
MKVAKRRRREGKTDYAIRIKLLKSEKPRLVFRKTNKYLVVQYLESKEAKDSIKIGMTSSALIRYGWPKKAQGSLKSLPACYLMGILFGKTIVSKKLESPIVDFGMYRVLSKSRLQGFVKGLVDSGLNINYNEEFFPSEERIEGGHLKNKIPFGSVKANIEHLKETEDHKVKTVKKPKTAKTTKNK